MFEICDTRELRLVLVEVPHLVLVANCFTVTGVTRVVEVLLDLARDVCERDVQDPREAPQLLVGALLR